jgi:hypothetical protein
VRRAGHGDRRFGKDRRGMKQRPMMLAAVKTMTHPHPQRPPPRLDPQGPAKASAGDGGHEVGSVWLEGGRFVLAVSLQCRSILHWAIGRKIDDA